MRAMKKPVIFGSVLMLSMMFTGCCSNYSTYANSMAQDLEALDATYRGYVMSDNRLSEADRKARLSVIAEMQSKTQVAISDTK